MFTLNTSTEGEGITDEGPVQAGYFYNTYNMHVVTNRLHDFISMGKITMRRIFLPTGIPPQQSASKADTLKITHT